MTHVVDTVAVGELQTQLMIVKARGRLKDDISVIDDLIDRSLTGRA